MAIPRFNPLQRRMFNQVAAQPLQVPVQRAQAAAQRPQAPVQRAQVAVPRPQVAARPIDPRAVPFSEPGEGATDYEGEYLTVTQAIDYDRSKDEDVSELLSLREKIVQDAEDAGRPIDLDPLGADEDVQTVGETVNKALDQSVVQRKVSLETAEDAKKKVKSTLANLAKTEDSLEAQLKLVTGEPVDLETYQSQAKKLLGVDEDESDVPDWAAPIFMFGLKLMQGPVSSKTQGATGLGGLLSDIGAAGEVGFKYYAVERARKQKEKAAIATMAFKLKTASDANKLKLIEANIESQRWYATFALGLKKEERLTATALNKKMSGQKARIALSIHRMSEQYTEKANIDEKSRFIVSFHNLLNATSKDKGPEEVARILDNPVKTHLIAAFAAKKAGLRPEFQTKKITVGPGIVVEYSVGALNRHARKNAITPEKALAQMIADPKNTKWNSIALGVNFGKDQFEYKPEIRKGITTPIWIDTNKRNTEVNLAIKAGRDVDRSKFETRNTPYIEGSPNLKKIDLGSFAGEKKWAYVDFEQLALENTRRETWNKNNSKKTPKPLLTLEKLLKEPTIHPKIISNKFSDTSGALGNISFPTIYTGANTSQKFMFRASQLDVKRKEIAADLNISPDEVPFTKVPFEILLKHNVLTPMGREKVHTEPITRIVYDENGFSSTTGASGDVLGLESKQAQKELDNEVTAGLAANSSSFRIRHIYSAAAKTANVSPQQISSRLAEWKSGLVAAMRLAGFEDLGKPGYQEAALGRLNNFVMHRDSNAENMAATRKMITNWSGSFDKWAKTSITDNAVRQQLKSLYIDLAFQMASSREGGKLTDKDVDWAFKTLGFDTGAYFQTPETILAGLDTAMNTINKRLETKVAKHYPPEKMDALEKWNKDNPNNKKWVLEEIFRGLQRGVDPGTGVDRGKIVGPEGEIRYIYRYDRREGRQVFGVAAPRTAVSGVSTPAVDPSRRGVTPVVDPTIFRIPPRAVQGHIFGELNNRQIKVPPNLQTAFSDLKANIETVGTAKGARIWAKAYVDKRVKELTDQGVEVTDDARKVYKEEASRLFKYLDGIIPSR